MKTYEQLSKQYGTVDYQGRTLALCDQAEVGNYGTEGGVRYYCNAIDKQGNNYKVTWDTTEAWDQAVELCQLLADFENTKKHHETFSNEDLERVEELQGIKGLPDVNDESESCDWENPSNIEEI